MSTLPGCDHMSSSTPPLDGKGSTDSVAKVGKSTKRMGPSYGVPFPKNSRAGFNANLLMQYITVYTPNSVHWNQFTTFTTTTVSLGAFRRNCLPLLIPWHLLSGPCASLRAF